LRGPGGDAGRHFGFIFAATIDAHI
jgi:hypothetical protein